MADSGFLQRTREAIDELDDQILSLLVRRGELAQAVAQSKQESATEAVVYYRPEREAEVLTRLSRSNPGPYPSSAVRAIYREIISATLALEQPLEVAAASVETVLAARTLFGFSGLVCSFSSAEQALNSVVSCKHDLAIVAVEDASLGLLTEPLQLVVDSGLHPVAEIVINMADEQVNANLIRFVAMGRQACDATGADRTMLVVRGETEPALVAGVKALSSPIIFRQSSTLAPAGGCRQVLMVEGHLQDGSVKALIDQLTANQLTVTATGSWPVVEKTALDE